MNMHKLKMLIWHYSAVVFEFNQASSGSIVFKTAVAPEYYPTVLYRTKFLVVVNDR